CTADEGLLRCAGGNRTSSRSEPGAGGESEWHQCSHRRTRNSVIGQTTRLRQNRVVQSGHLHPRASSVPPPTADNPPNPVTLLLGDHAFIQACGDSSSPR